MRKVIYSEAGGIILFVSLLQGLRLAAQVYLFQLGYLSISADEFSRAVLAARWSLNPSFDLLADLKQVWLPFEKYLNGFALVIWPDVIWAPRVTVFLASCLVITAAFLIIYRLFDNFWVAAISVTFISFVPWFVWLSGTPALDMYYLAFFMTGTAFLVYWLKDDRPGFWVPAGLSLMISTGFHVPAWVFVNFLLLLTVPVFIRDLQQRRTRHLLQLIGFYFLSNLVVITFTVIQFLDTGQLFHFLSNHTEYSKWAYGGYDIPIWEKLAYYPKLIFQNISKVVWPVVLIGLGFLIKERRSHWLGWMPLLLLVGTLGFYSLMNVVSVPATAAPGRYSLFYLLLLAPYVGLAVYQSYYWLRSKRAWILSFPLAAAVAVMFLWCLWWGVHRTTKKFPGGMPVDTVAAGRTLNQLMNNSEDGEAENYLLELAYWDYLGVQTTAWHYDQVVYDREVDIYDRNKVSVLLQDPQRVYAYLDQNKVRFIALKSQELEDKVSSLDYIQQVQRVGDWTLFEFAP